MNAWDNPSTSEWFASLHTISKEKASMKVYVVLGRDEYEGFSDLFMKTFTSKEAAEEYGLKLTTGIVDDDVTYTFDYSEVFEQEVE